MTRGGPVAVGSPPKDKGAPEPGTHGISRTANEDACARTRKWRIFDDVAMMPTGQVDRTLFRIPAAIQHAADGPLSQMCATPHASRA